MIDITIYSSNYPNKGDSHFSYLSKELADYMNQMTEDDYVKMTDFYNEANTSEAACWVSFVMEIDMEIAVRRSDGRTIDPAYIQNSLHKHLAKLAVKGGNCGMKVPMPWCAPPQDHQSRVFKRIWGSGSH